MDFIQNAQATFVFDREFPVHVTIPLSLKSRRVCTGRLFNPLELEQTLTRLGISQEDKCLIMSSLESRKQINVDVKATAADLISAGLHYEVLVYPR